MEFLHWNYYPILSGGENSMNKNLGYIASRFANSIDTIQVNGVKNNPIGFITQLKNHQHTGTDQFKRKSKM